MGIFVIFKAPSHLKTLTWVWVNITLPSDGHIGWELQKLPAHTSLPSTFGRIAMDQLPPALFGKTVPFNLPLRFWWRTRWRVGVTTRTWWQPCVLSAHELHWELLQILMILPHSISSEKHIGTQTGSSLMKNNSISLLLGLVTWQKETDFKILPTSPSAWVGQIVERLFVLLLVL